MQSARISSVDKSSSGLPTKIHRFVVCEVRGRAKKRIRAAHAEKQQIRKTCNRPNRLNLFDLTAGAGRRSKFFWENARFVGPCCSGGLRPPAGVTERRG